MNNEELLKEFDRRQKELRDEFIAKLEDDKKKFELTYPRDDDDIYFISNVDAEICFARFHSSNETDRCAFEHGLYFKTQEEAEKFLKERRLMFKISKWAEMKNEGWKPDWNNMDELRYTLFYSDETNELLMACSRTNRDFSILPAFKSSKIARECIKEFEEEIREVLL